MTEEHIGPEQLLAMLRAAATGWQEGRAETDALDAALGDGDHGSGLAAGFAVAIVGLTTEASMSEILLQTASQLMNRMGGAAGALFGSFFLGIATAIHGQSSLSMAQFAAACAAGLASVQCRSRADLGDKTMLDALEPAVRALEAGARSGATFAEALQSAGDAAQTGAEATIPLVARHGRAKYLGERSCGHMDAGARSVATLFAAWHNVCTTSIENKG